MRRKPIWRLKYKAFSWKQFSHCFIRSSLHQPEISYPFAQQADIFWYALRIFFLSVDEMSSWPNDQATSKLYCKKVYVMSSPGYSPPISSVSSISSHSSSSVWPRLGWLSGLELRGWTPISSSSLCSAAWDWSENKTWSVSKAPRRSEFWHLSFGVCIRPLFLHVLINIITVAIFSSL